MAILNRFVALQAAIAWAIASSVSRAGPPPPARFVEPTKDGPLKYLVADNGDRMPDYSFAGYAAGERPIPTVPAKVRVALGDDDVANFRAIQAALDEVAAMAPGADGLRGAVLLPPGEFKIATALTFKRDGVVLRGSGAGDGGTTLVKTGTPRSTVFQVRGKPLMPAGDAVAIDDAYVPVNASVIHAKGFAAGEFVQITRPSTKEWIAAIGMDDLGGDRHGPSWRPGSRDVGWLREITKVDGDAVTLDAPLTLALDAKLGGGTVQKVDATGLVRNVGIENLRLVSTFDEKNSKDEEHAWFGVGFDNARDCWVRRVTFKNLAGSAVAAWSTASRVTVEDCKSLAPVGEIGGWRRNAFYTGGQQVLMQRLFSEAGVHDFAIGLAAAGPNAFVQCESRASLGESGPIDSAACGTLFDRVRIDGQSLSLRNRTYQGQGVGWASFNGMLWNSTAPLIVNERPAGANNFAFGTSGEFSGNGAWYGSNDDVNPDSLYYAQLADRIGKAKADARALLDLPPVQGTRAPTVEGAAEAIAASMRPRVTIGDWIDQLAGREPLDATPDGVAEAKSPADSTTTTTTRAAAKSIAIRNGWITVDGAVVAGGEMGVPWWNGGVRPDDLAKAQPALTRFVPGRAGPGLTDDLTDVANDMVKRGDVSVWQHPPLWYERRRDDHERVQRIDGDVVAPFYETPWARSGTGAASDGLSKWDVTKPDAWYFSRLRQFADLGAQRGLVLFSGLYMQHNVLEAGAHYADAPWRPQNNVNPVGIPEPVFFAGDKLIYVAQQFYDVTNNDRAATHRAYMRAALDQLADKPNVIFFLSEEYTGPLAFTQFWLDTIAEWERDTGKHATIALYATKDVTDAVLGDEKRATVVDVIYNRYNHGDDGFWLQGDGKWYAPEGGKNLSPRQWVRLLKPKNAGFDQVLQTVREYRTKYPDKPFVYAGPRELAWAVLLGGGSLAELPKTTDPALLAAIAKMKPTKDGLADDAGNALSYGGDAGRYAEASNVRAIDMKTGQIAASKDGAKLFWISATK